jgi:hypothetical protein
MIIMNLDEFTKEKLWTILVDTVHASVMYPSNKAYVRDFILPEKPDVAPLELSCRLNMSLGEAIVVIDELTEERKNKA